MPKVEDTQENFDTCMKYCKPCLTYSDVEGEGLYCAKGKSSVPRNKNGCNCGTCEVQKKCGNRAMYYCINGAASG